MIIARAASSAGVRRKHEWPEQPSCQESAEQMRKQHNEHKASQSSRKNLGRRDERRSARTSGGNCETWLAEKCGRTELLIKFMQCV